MSLLTGDLIDKTGQKPPHASAIHRLQELFAQLFGVARLRVQLPMEAGAADRETSMPEPDLAVVSELNNVYEERHPGGTEMTLVVEVADTTIHPDLTRKRDLYASAGVREYWVLDLPGRRLVVHRDLAGTNASMPAFKAMPKMKRLTLEGQTVKVAGLLSGNSHLGF